MKEISISPPIFSKFAYYKNRVIHCIKNDERNFPVFRKKTKYVIPISWRRKKLYANMLDEVFGNNCYICGFGGRLELAHMFYAKDSVKGNATGARTMARLRETLTYPERFRRLCSVCHDIFDHARRHGGFEYLKKVDSLIESAKLYEKATSKF